MTKVFVNLGMSLDGFVAGTNRGPHNPLGDRGKTIHEWMFRTQMFREHLGIGSGGETGVDHDRLARLFKRIGANIMGKRMFEEGEAAWPERAPFGVPVFVLTHERRAPWPRPGGTTFHFINDGIEAALARASEVAGTRDIRISGGAETVRAYLAAGLVDELELAIAPLLLGDGLRLFDGLPPSVGFELVEASHTSVAHLRFACRRA